MVTTLNFKDQIDEPKWRPMAIPIFNTRTDVSSGSQIAQVIGSDLRNNEDRHPIIYVAVQLNSRLHGYNTKNDGWFITGLAIITAGGRPIAAFFMPAQGPRGTIAAGATTTSIPLTTALPATVGVNQLANRGDGRGFKVRIIGNAAGSSGKTEERLIIANTGQTTTPTLLLDSALSFTPIAGDRYEFLSGRLFVHGGVGGGGEFQYYDVLTNSLSGALAQFGSFGNRFDGNLVGLDELLVPYDRSPGEGFFGILTATATAATTLTGQAVSGDAGVVANQYRNFQIRIVEDTAIPTAVGQRRNITSHTAGPSPIYTVPAWTVTPSATARYVIENNGDRILAWTHASTATGTYTISTNTWDSGVTFANRPTSPFIGLMSAQAFAIEPDTASPPNARNSHIFSFTGGDSNNLDLFDISAAATGAWTAGITYGSNSSLVGFPASSSQVQEPATNQGRYMHINQGGLGTGGTSGTGVPSQRMYRFDMRNRILEQYAFFRIAPDSASTVQVSGLASGTIHAMASSVFVDGSTKLSFIYLTPIIGGISRLYQLPITR